MSLTPAATETLFALGVGDRIVGKVEDFTARTRPRRRCDPGRREIRRIGSVDVEKIVAD